MPGSIVLDGLCQELATNLTQSEIDNFLSINEAEEYTLDSYEYISEDTLKLYEALDKRIMNISSDVKKEFKKLYIAYKVDTNFVDIVIQKSKLRISINMKFNDVIDPKGICIDITNKGRWGNGNVEIFYDDIKQLDNIMEIVMQSYKRQIDDDSN